MTSSLIAKFKLFVPQIWQQTVRHRGKFNYKFPKPRHDVARFLEDITRPVIIKEIPNPVDTCVKRKTATAHALKFGVTEAIEFEQFLARHALGLMQKHEVMLICHKYDCSGEVFRRNRVEFKRNETLCWSFNTVVMKLLIENNPKYKNLEPIVEAGLGKNLYLFCDEKNLKKNLTTIRKIPHITLLGAMLKNEYLLTRNGIQDYANMPDLDTLRGQLVGMLNSHLASITTTLSTPSSQLAMILEQHSKSGEPSQS